MTQKEEIKRAIGHLENAIDYFPDKTAKISRENDIIHGMISSLKLMIGEVEY